MTFCLHCPFHFRFCMTCKESIAQWETNCFTLWCLPTKERIEWQYKCMCSSSHNDKLYNARNCSPLLTIWSLILNTHWTFSIRIKKLKLNMAANVRVSCEILCLFNLCLIKLVLGFNTMKIWEMFYRLFWVKLYSVTWKFK